MGILENRRRMEAEYIDVETEEDIVSEGGNTASTCTEI